MITYQELNRRVGRLFAEERGEWCGVPMPMPGFRLTIEDRNPWRPMVAELQDTIQDTPPVDGGRVCSSDETRWHPVNTWWSTRLRQTVGIARHEDGRYASFGGTYDFAVKGEFLIKTLGVSNVWPLDAEVQAMETLAEHLDGRPHLFEMYVVTGTFIETSKRSGLTYVFRRCKPTLVYNAHAQRFLCALCLHPIGYYEQTHAGSMVPTDDVIAHLLMMRADELLLWRRATQHPIDRPEAGL